MALLITSISDYKDMNEVSKKTVNSHYIHQNEFPFQVRMIVPSELHQIQPISNQVSNCDEIEFDSNSKWHKFFY